MSPARSPFAAQGLYGGRYPTRATTAAVRVHRRVWWGAPVTAGSVLRWPAAAWVAATRPAVRGGDPSWRRQVERRFERDAGVAVPVQRRRLAALAAVRVPVAGAYRLGLPRDDLFGRWFEFVVGGEHGWNAAVGGRAALADQRVLGDKELTRRLLAAVGVPTPPGSLLRAGSPLHRLRALHDRWGPELFVKPVTGSGGRGAFVVTPDRTEYYRAGGRSAAAAADLRRALGRSDHLVQPLLRTCPDLAAAAGPAASQDVLTLRVVTRDLGRGPQVFSMVAEVPAPRQRDGRQRYHHLAVASDGRIARGTVPTWLRADDPGPLEALENRMAGRQVPGLAEIRSAAVAAHGVVPRMFAVAWDVALTSGGPLFLEGNAGFGTVVPQQVAGGLLAGL